MTSLRARRPAQDATAAAASRCTPCAASPSRWRPARWSRCSAARARARRRCSTACSAGRRPDRGAVRCPARRAGRGRVVDGRRRPPAVRPARGADAWPTTWPCPPGWPGSATRAPPPSRRSRCCGWPTWPTACRRRSRSASSSGRRSPARSSSGPQFLVADEPTGRLDEELSTHVLPTLREVYAARGTGVLSPATTRSSSPPSDRVVRLSDGLVEH